MLYTFAMAAMMFAMSSCQQSKEDYLKELNEFVADVKADAEDFTEDDWNEAVEDFDKLVKKADNFEDFSVKEAMQVVKIQGEFAAIKLKAGIKEGTKKLQELKKEMEKEN